MADIRRVLMTCDTVGGVWTFALELAKGLTGNGVEVLLASFGGEPSPEQRAAAAAIPDLFLVSTTFRLEWMENPWEDVAESARWLTRVAREYSPDVVHLNSFGHGDVKFNCPVLLTGHSCVLSWWEAVKGTPLPPTWRIYECVVKRALNSANIISTPSRFMATALAKHYSFDRNKLRIVYNGRDPDRFRRGAKAPIVFAAGRLWDEAKNAAALARVAPALSCPVFFAGEGSVEGVRTLGRLSTEQMAEWYSKAAVYAFPARYEPFGLSVLEAALSGCALVLGDIPSLREIWDDAAIFVPPDDSESLRAAIQSLMDDTALCEAVGRRAYQRARNFTASRMIRNYIGLYENAVGSRIACAS
jgi:glycogen synthase